MTTPRESNVAALAELYDRFSELHARNYGRNLHVGYWHDGQDQASWETAAEQLTTQMIDLRRPQPGQRILDVGCGLGQPAFSLALAHDVSIVGISISRRQIELANARSEELGLADRVRFEYVDVMALPYPDSSFDAAWFFESLLHMADKVTALRQAARVLRPGARLALADMFHEPGQDWSLEHRPLVVTICLDEYQELLSEAGLELLEIRDVTANLGMPDAVKAAMRAKMRDQRDELVEIAGQHVVEQFLDPEESTFSLPGGGYALIAAQCL